jgi:hypothetical protein
VAGFGEHGDETSGSVRKRGSGITLTCKDKLRVMLVVIMEMLSMETKNVT